VGPFASTPEALLPITQATAALSRVNLHQIGSPPKNHVATLRLLPHWAMGIKKCNHLSTDQVVALLYALQAQNAGEQAKIYTD